MLLSDAFRRIRKRTDKQKRIDYHGYGRPDDLPNTKPLSFKVAL